VPLAEIAARARVALVTAKRAMLIDFTATWKVRLKPADITR
jgi:hypothetical protein